MHKVYISSHDKWKWNPTMLSLKDASMLFREVYPLHIVSVIAYVTVVN